VDRWLTFFTNDVTWLNRLRLIAKNPAFTLKDSGQRDLIAREYKKSSALYYQGHPDFDQLLDRIGKHLNLM